MMIKLTEKMKRWAIDKENKHKKGKRFDKNVDKRNSIYIGYLGEAVFLNLYTDAIHVNNSEFDFLLWEVKYEVKSYWSKFEPKQDYFLKIPKLDASRVANDTIYCFICIDTVNDMAWLLGFMPCIDFKRIAVFRAYGEKQSGCDFFYTTDCYEIQVKHLK